MLYFRQNVDALENLNRRWRLYSKQIFLEHLMAEFLSVLVKVLVSRSHNLLRDEISLAVYNMASTDFPAFFNKFIPHFLGSLGGGGGDCVVLDENQQSMLSSGFNRDTDLPSFVSNMTRYKKNKCSYWSIELKLSALF